MEAKKAAGYYTPEPPKPEDLKTSGRAQLEKYLIVSRRETAAAIRC